MQPKISSIFKHFSIFLFFCILISFAKEKPQEYAKFKSVKCIASNKSLSSNYTCRIKPYNRFIAKLTILVDIRVPTYDIFVGRFLKTFNKTEIF